MDGYISGWGRNKFYKVKCFNFTTKNFIKIKISLLEEMGIVMECFPPNENVLIQKKKKKNNFS